MQEHEPDQNVKRKQFDKEEEKTHTLFHSYLLHHWWVVYNQRKLFFSVVDYKVFHISIILGAGCNEIESKHCKLYTVSRSKKRKIQGENKNTK